MWVAWMKTINKKENKKTQSNKNEIKQTKKILSKNLP